MSICYWGGEDEEKGEGGEDSRFLELDVGGRRGGHSRGESGHFEGE